MLTGSGSGYYNGGEWPELARSLLNLLVIITTDNEENGADDNETAEVGSTPKTQFGAGVLDRRGRLNWCGGTKSTSGQPPRHPGSGARYGNGFPPRYTRIMERGEMSRIDLHKLALRMKIVEMLKIHLGRRRLESAPIRWRRLIRPN